ncbi:hypothetical protein [Mucilaginibacter sp. L196]|uniref:hypothetical protein n=1 Tax=Mucilaginibacter sp. L196 TaxID=1641870 RepID=UPI00131E928B|nr:hypothetical protein [Mucilaginibacter sp. L196]
MESILLLLILAPTALFLILKFDTKQNRKIKKVLKDTHNIEPLFLMRATEQKLKELNTQLYGNIALIANGAHSGRININEGARQMLTSQLSRLTSDYNSGELSLKAYNSKLSEMIQTVNQVKYLNFEQINN